MASLSAGGLLFAGRLALVGSMAALLLRKRALQGTLARTGDVSHELLKPGHFYLGNHLYALLLLT